MLQILDFDDDPAHCFPPPDGLGLLQARILVCLPRLPHVLEQAEYFPHLPHLPFTTIVKDSISF